MHAECGLRIHVSSNLKYPPHALNSAQFRASPFSIYWWSVFSMFESGFLYNALLRGGILCHQVWLWLATISRLKISLFQQLLMGNHTLTWWHYISPIKGKWADLTHLADCGGTSGFFMLTSSDGGSATTAWAGWFMRPLHVTPIDSWCIIRIVVQLCPIQCNIYPLTIL